jgi:phosphoserine phosphatase
MKPLRIYDIDGTITIPGHDLWYLTTRSLSANPSRFDQAVAFWKQSLKNGASAYESSKLMMQRGIEWIHEKCHAELIKQRAKELSDDLIQNQHYYPSAIEHINASIEAGFQIVFSTTNYCEGAEAFLEILVERRLVQDDFQDRIRTSGSIVDWMGRSLIHFNMGKDKVVGICNRLAIPIDQLANFTDSAYGDDPEGNDQGILSFAPRSFVIANPKNLEANLPANTIRTSWEEILENHF